jgi:hypothetical protein
MTTRKPDPASRRNRANRRRFSPQARNHAVLANPKDGVLATSPPAPPPGGLTSEWHELAALWRIQAKATGSNVINQPFASRSSDGWRSQTLTRGGRKIGEVAGGHETTAPAMPRPLIVAPPIGNVARRRTFGVRAILEKAHPPLTSRGASSPNWRARLQPPCRQCLRRQPPCQQLREPCRVLFLAGRKSPLT